MRKFLIEASVFIIVVMIISFLIAHIKISEKYIIHKTINTSYEKIAWNLNLISNTPNKIKNCVIFLGPSPTQGGICDSTLVAHGVKAINIGVNHGGNEIELFFLDKIIIFKPEKVYLHLSKETLVNLHPMTPLLYTPSSLLSIGQSLNVSFCKYLFKRVFFVLDYLIWNVGRKEHVKAKYFTYGVRHEKNEFTIEAYSLIKKNQTDALFEGTNVQSNGFRLRSELGKNSFGIVTKRLFRFAKYFGKNINFLFNARCQQVFVSKAFEIASASNIEIAELYLPVVADARAEQDFNQLFYSPRNTYAISSLKSFSFLDKADYWTDMNHLSKKGAILFTEKLIQQEVVKPIVK